MQKPKRCGIIFLSILFSCFNLALGNDKAPLDLEPIVITKSKVQLLNAYFVKSDTLENLSLSSPVESLNNLPLDLQSRSLKAGIQTDFSLRGSTFQGVTMLLDGNRINDPQTGHHNCDIPVTKQDIEKIEVIPGVSSALFGPDAIGGAINFILKKPKDKKRVLELSTGQYQTKSGALSLSDKLGDLGVRVSLENQESDGFYEDTDFKKFTTHLYSALDLPDGEFDLALGYQEKEFGAYDFYTPKSGYQSKEWTKTYLLNTNLDLERQGFFVRPNFLWRRHEDKFMLDKTLIRSRYLNHHHTDIYTPSIYLQKETDVLGKLGLGLEYGVEQINSTNLGKHNRDHKSVFMDEGKGLTDALSMGLSLRWDDFEGFGENYTGSASFRYSISAQNSLHFGLSRSIRVPSFTELYYNDPTTLGQANLSAETSLSYQLGYEHKIEKWCWGSTFFFRQEEDFIDWIKRSPSQTKWQVENITESQVLGLESYLRLDITERFSLDSNYTYINKYANDRGFLYKYGPNYIQHLANATFNLSLPFGIQRIGVSYKKKPQRNGWCLLNVNFSYRLNQNSQIFLDVTNLLNVEYQEIEGIPQPGRWAQAGLKFVW